MRLHSFDESCETDQTYWRKRAISLEVLVCDLLAKNQDMRFLLEATMQGPQEPRILSHQLDS